MGILLCLCFREVLFYKEKIIKFLKIKTNEKNQKCKMKKVQYMWKKYRGSKCHYIISREEVCEVGNVWYALILSVINTTSYFFQGYN